MTAIERFQKRFGSKWAAISHDPAFSEALQIANYNTIQWIGTLTAEQIRENGVVILAELKGRLAHEEELIKLSVVEPKSVNDIEATYPNPEDELVEQTNGTKNGNDEAFLSAFQVDNPATRTDIEQASIDAARLKKKRQANAAKARAEKAKKHKAKLSKSTRK